MTATNTQIDPNSPLGKKIAHARSDEGKYAQFDEIHRICNMPISEQMTSEEVESYNRDLVMSEAYESGFRFSHEQVRAIYEYDMVGGLIAPLGVGMGKTAITLIIANRAYQKGIKKMLLCVPPQVMGQLVDSDIRWCRQRSPLSYPIHVMGGLGAKQRRMLSKSGKPGLYIMPYSLLSVEDTEEVLHAMSPGIIICDEAHRVSKKSSACTDRITKYIEKHSPEYVALSGTLTSKSVMDYWHMTRWALGNNNPLPNASTLAKEWASYLDAAAGGSTEGARSGPITPLVQWSRKHFPNEKITQDLAGFRKSYKMRFNSCPGVVSSGDAAIKCTITMQNRKILKKDCEASPGWGELQRLTKQVTGAWLTPNEDAIDHSIHKFKWLSELSAGFYNELVWQTPEKYAEHRPGMSEAEAEELLEMAKIHHTAGQEYAVELRKFIEGSRQERMDTPMLVGLSMHNYGEKFVSAKLYDLWKKHKDLDFEHRPERQSNAIRVCPYKIDAAVAWAKDLPKGRGGVLWVLNKEIGCWVFDALVMAGIDALHAPAGDIAGEALRRIGDRGMGGKGDRVAVASIDSHGTGKNLQAFEFQYFVQWPRQAKKAEQTMGRLHRQGQLADEIFVVTNHTTEFDEINFSACVNDALYAHQTLGSRQKLIYGSYDPLPKVFPSEVLREKGIQDAIILDAEGRKLRDDKFGSGQKEGRDGRKDSLTPTQ